MKTYQAFLLSFFMILATGFVKTDFCENNTILQDYSLAGEWELVSNTPEQTLQGSRVKVDPVTGEAVFTLLKENSQCYEPGNIHWRDIKAKRKNNFQLQQLLSNCNPATKSYTPAHIQLINADELKLVGTNLAGQFSTQIWHRVNE